MSDFSGFATSLEHELMKSNSPNVIFFRFNLMAYGY